MKIKYPFVKNLVMALFCLLPLAAICQPPDDPGGEPVPLDGGVSLMIAAGVGYGVKKYRDNRQRNTNKKTGL